MGSLAEDYYKPTPRWAKRLSLILATAGTCLTGGLGVAGVSPKWIFAGIVFTILGKVIPEFFTSDSDLDSHLKHINLDSEGIISNPPEQGPYSNSDQPLSPRLPIVDEQSNVVQNKS